MEIGNLGTYFREHQEKELLESISIGTRDFLLRCIETLLRKFLKVFPMIPKIFQCPLGFTDISQAVHMLSISSNISPIASEK